MTAHRIHLSPPDMSDRERSSLLTAFDSNWIAPAGPALDEFESRLRTVSGREAAVALTSGTAALHLALQVLGVGQGDIVLVPTVTFVASANVVLYVGATPHFVDCDPQTGNIDPAQLERAITELAARGRKPAAVMTVDLYGACADYTAIEALCEVHGIPIVEDAAESIGSSHEGRPAGSFGTLAAFSFNGNKLVTTGGGGALLGPAHLIERAKKLASQSREPELHFEHHEVGYAYRMSNIAAAIGCGQLERLEEMIGRTRAVHHRYVEQLSAIPGIRVLDQDKHGVGNAWLTVIELDQHTHPTPAQVCTYLATHDIEARPAWKPMHLQPLYLDCPATGGAVAETHFSSGLCLPSGSTLNEQDQDRVVATLRHLVGAGASIDLASLDFRGEQPRQHQDSPAAMRRAA